MLFPADSDNPISSSFNMYNWTIHDLYNEYVKPYKPNENPYGLYLWQFYYKKFAMILKNRRVYETNDEWLKSHKKIIEKYLFENGFLVIFNHPILGMLVTRGNIKEYDVNGYPAKIEPMYEKTIEGISDYKPLLSINNDTLDSSDKACVVIYDTEDWLINTNVCFGLIRDIVDLDLIIRTQCKNQATPLVGFIDNDNDIKFAEKTINQINNGLNALVISKKNKQMINDIKAIDFNLPFNIESLQNLKNTKINELLAYMGVDNLILTEKKERMIVDEVESNNELLTYTLRAYIDLANEGLENMKKIFGIEYKVTIGEIERPEEGTLDKEDKIEDDNSES